MKGIKKLNIIEKYGFTDEIKSSENNLGKLVWARVTSQHRDLYQVVTNQGFVQAKISGKMNHQIINTTEYPAVGDWVLISVEANATGIIRKLWPRKSILAREASGNDSSGQVIASNIDTIFICMSLNTNFNPRRVERYLTMAWDSGATPVVVLTKSDLCADITAKLRELEDVCMGVDTVVCSFEMKTGLDKLSAYIKPQKTVAFIGSSGVGKSSLINWFLGDSELETKQVREGDDKGRHTTTSRQLILLPNGGIVIDTPGMRELQLFVGNLSKTFEDITELAKECRFRDCSHQNEPGCAVKEAVKDGRLDADRLKSYLKLQREMSYSKMNSRQLENEKINQAFGSKKAMKKSRKHMQQIKRR
ncbi:putative ribosome bioproteinis GTPase RsgA [Companilactobacillus bobalius]|uniref:Small ribosomal subunit biogenesis GTPase RsgA n=2 Tax=Companilactobacillus bobalius TaxID=2801451 RepID=A0A202FF91_9LACO|nr:ribosome biogenesis gtpase rsga2 [Companilactobacillus bobalius DSM 19674]OVE99102.1 putative ribosome bioproteinis GTPase RsgA [Companilactobacillus bobalius]